MKKQIHINKLEKAAFILKTIAHPYRLAIINLLSYKNEMSVNEICESIKLEQSLTSHHLNNMKTKGILGNKRDGKQIFYFLKEKEIADIFVCIKNCNANM